MNTKSLPSWTTKIDEISSNWSKFLFDFCLLSITGKTIAHKFYNDKNLGSWIIEVDDKRLIYLGKVSWLVSQTQCKNEWFDNYIIKESEVTYETISLFLKQMK